MKTERKPRKKLSEMTPFERVDSRMKGMTWDEAEEIGTEILGRCMALHVYARKEGEEYFEHLMRSVCKKSDEWAHTPAGMQYLAIAAVGHKLEKDGK